RAQLRYVLLFWEEIDHGVRGGGDELAGVGAGESADAARDLDHGALEAETDPQEGHLLLARVSGGIHLALDAANTESARDQDAVHRPERLLGRRSAEVVRRDPMDLDIAPVMDPPVSERLHHRQVRVAEIHVLAD